MIVRKEHAIFASVSEIFITVERAGSEVEKWPYRGYIQFKVPTDDFEAMMWQV